MGRQRGQRFADLPHEAGTQAGPDHDEGCGAHVVEHDASPLGVGHIGPGRPGQRERLVGLADRDQIAEGPQHVRELLFLRG